MNRHRIFLALVGFELLLLVGLTASGVWERHAGVSLRAENRSLAAALKLTDLALWTEARYTRNPSQADRFAPFQDLPGALEHFPAGAILGPWREAGP